MYPNRSTCRQIQDFVAGYKIHVARYKIHAGYMYPATCRQCVPGFKAKLSQQEQQEEHINLFIITSSLEITQHSRR